MRRRPERLRGTREATHLATERRGGKLVMLAHQRSAYGPCSRL